MALRVEHEIHRRRASRNLGLLAVLLLFAALVFGLTIAKVQRGDNMKAWDNRIDPEMVPGAGTPFPDTVATPTPITNDTPAALPATPARPAQ